MMMLECDAKAFLASVGVNVPAGTVWRRGEAAAGVNVAARHRKPTQVNPQGGIDRKPAPMHISNVAVADKDGKPTRVRFEDRDGKKVRVAVKSGEVL